MSPDANEEIHGDQYDLPEDIAEDQEGAQKSAEADQPKADPVPPHVVTPPHGLDPGGLLDQLHLPAAKIKENGKPQRDDEGEDREEEAHAADKSFPLPANEEEKESGQQGEECDQAEQREIQNVHGSSSSGSGIKVQCVGSRLYTPAL